VERESLNEGLEEGYTLLEVVFAFYATDYVSSSPGSHSFVAVEF